MYVLYNQTAVVREKGSAAKFEKMQSWNLPEKKDLYFSHAVWSGEREIEEKI